MLVGYRFPVEGFAALQAAPTKDCVRAALLFKSLDALLDELLKLSDLKPQLAAKSSKVRSEPVGSLLVTIYCEAMVIYMDRDIKKVT